MPGFVARQKICSSILARPEHEPVRYTQYLRLRDRGESELLIEANVLELVSLQVRERAALIYARAELYQHCAADSLTLNAEVNRYWSQMPVRFARIAARPLSDPLENSHRRAKWVTKDH